MRRMFGWMAVVGLMLAGCSTPAPSGPAPSATSTVTETPAAEPVAADTGTSDTGSRAAEGSETPATAEPALAPATGDAPDKANSPAGGDAAPKPATDDAPNPAAGDAPKLEAVPLANGVATLGPDNTKIQFVGTHAGAKPDPRVGGFAKFTGQAKVDPASKSLASVSVDIDTTSVFTPIQKLTDHLKTPDFFEVREYPTAKFASTKIVPGNGGQAQITGNLTLHGETKEISFPATVQVSDEGLTVHSEFSIDRSQFGMTFSPDKVENKVALTVAVGERTKQ